MNWEEKDNKLTKEFSFKGFNDALNFVNKVASLANQANHHPDILIHDYKKVTITLTTHCEGNTVTEKDHALAKQIDKL